ncbi:MAG: metallophosphoesterase family protein [Firmicutes bacterium]|nr:metallophosphoesterase family protein [Bacillota bacterium]
MRYYISDNHFTHSRICEVDQRGFENVYQMDQYMIEQWNKRVTNNDEVYILGDFSWAKGIETWNILNQLNGKITLIEGNHDYFYLDDPDFVDERFEEILNYAEDVDGNRKVILSHYPIPFYNHQFNTTEDGKPEYYMLYGHLHNTYDEYMMNDFINRAASKERRNARDEMTTTPFHMINVFALFSDYTPLTQDEWIELDQKRRDFINSFGEMDYDQWMEVNKLVVQKSKNKWK